MFKTALLSLLTILNLHIFAQSTTIANLETEMVWVAAGKFEMGMNGGLAKESPAHWVELNAYFIGKFEVTQQLWVAVMGYNPSHFQPCIDCPVENVRWPEIEKFLLKLNTLTGKKYRLPTEAEWEYAALGGLLSKGFTFPGSNNLEEVAWAKFDAGNHTHPVGQKTPNELGLYDMAGNVWEHCSDWYSPRWYKKSPAQNPRNDHRNWFKLLRGGSWRSAENRCYSKARNRDVPDHHKQNGGFRLVCEK